MSDVRLLLPLRVVLSSLFYVSATPQELELEVEGLSKGAAISPNVSTEHSFGFWLRASKIRSTFLKSASSSPPHNFPSLIIIKCSARNESRVLNDVQLLESDTELMSVQAVT
eukprot:4546408-Pleurochrysis_carterae.AAC.2